MHIEMIDLLRCPREHEETWLVAAFREMRGRFVVSGTLGCPVCSATFVIENGVADLRSEADRESVSDPLAQAVRERAPDSETTIRFAAMLGLTRAGALILTSGDAAYLSRSVSELADARVMALDPADSVEETERVAIVLAGERIPLATGSADGIVVGDRQPAIRIADAPRVMKPGARIVAVAGTQLGPRFRELAHDEHYVVGEAVGQLVTLKYP